MSSAEIGARKPWRSAYLAVALGSALGGLARWGLSLAPLAEISEGLPIGTLAVNILGSALIGFYASLIGPQGCLVVGAWQRHFVMTGVCGGFTTFSLFSLESLHFLQDGQLLAGAGLITLSVLLWMLSVWVGHHLGRLWCRRRCGGTQATPSSEQQL
ncbi:CrcB family protein [Aquibaculum sediminis]|uniref:CrcB family protein n=1 Tax=Aquibaculum sediminis TaxID=3231907 RepID=UPI0034513118